VLPLSTDRDGSDSVEGGTVEDIIAAAEQTAKQTA
jgi:hypothetical protein